MEHSKLTLAATGPRRVSMWRNHNGTTATITTAFYRRPWLVTLSDTENNRNALLFYNHRTSINRTRKIIYKQQSARNDVTNGLLWDSHSVCHPTRTYQNFTFRQRKKQPQIHFNRLMENRTYCAYLPQTPFSCDLPRLLPTAEDFQHNSQWSWETNEQDLNNNLTDTINVSHNIPSAEARLNVYVGGIPANNSKAKKN